MKHFKNFLFLFIVGLLVLPQMSIAAVNVYTWTQQTGSGTRMWKGIAGSQDLTKLYAVELSSGKIFTSTNSGVTWTQTAAPTASWVDVRTSDDAVKVAAISNFGGNVYVSADSGATWSLTTAGSREWTGIASSSTGNIVIASAYSDGVYLSTNAGSTWVKTTAPNGTWQSLAMSADGTRMVGVMDGGGLYVSSDTGATWSLVTALTSKVWRSVAMSADGVKMVAVVRGGGIYISTDSGATWMLSAAPTQNWQTVNISANGLRLVGAVDTGGIYTSSDTGATWTIQSVPGTRLWYGSAFSADGSKLALSVHTENIWTGVIDVVPPNIVLDPSFTNRALNSGVIYPVSATVTDNDAVFSVQFKVDGVDQGAPVTTPTSGDTYSKPINTLGLAEGPHTLSVLALDATGNETLSSSQNFYVFMTPGTLTQIIPIPSTVTTSSATYVYGATFGHPSNTNYSVQLNGCTGGATLSASHLSSTLPNQIFFEDLVIGTTYQCSLQIRDAALNNSNTLVIGPFTRVAQSTGNSSSSLKYGCKDPQAVNYTAFAAHDPSLCRYEKNVTNSLSSEKPERLTLTTTLSRGMNSPLVGLLQRYLIDMNTGPMSQALAQVGMSNYFGIRTEQAVKELQKKAGITPVNGKAGPKTRAYIESIVSLNK